MNEVPILEPGDAVHICIPLPMDFTPEIFQNHQNQIIEDYNRQGIYVAAITGSTGTPIPVIVAVFRNCEAERRNFRD